MLIDLYVKLNIKHLFILLLELNMIFSWTLRNNYIYKISPDIDIYQINFQNKLKFHRTIKNITDNILKEVNKSTTDYSFKVNASRLFK